MSRPLFSVKTVPTEALLPKKITIGRAYFIQDEQIIVIDHGDGRGAIRYGGRPGPQGIAGEPIPSLQGQIDELAAASLQTTLNIHALNTQHKAGYEHLQRLIQDNIDMMKSQNEENAKALMNLLIIVNKKFNDYDTAINTLAAMLSKFYPSNWGGSSGDGSNSTPAGVFTADDGTSYKIEQSYSDGDAGVVVLTLYDTSKISQLKAGDTVNIDSGYYVVNNISSNDDSGVISITLYES